MTFDILHVIGTRPNLPKFNPVWQAAKHFGFSQIWIHTSQHYSPSLFKDNEIIFDLEKPLVELGIDSTSSTNFISRSMEKLADIFQSLQPILVVVYGDVHSTLAASLACKLTNSKLVHIEAGLRSFDSTLPEEINRTIVDAVADFHFVTLPSAIDNLVKEGRNPKSIYFHGNTMIDSLKMQIENASLDTTLKRYGVSPNGFVIVTLHRGLNVDNQETLSEIMYQLQLLSDNIPVLFPVHPRTLKNLIPFSGVSIIPPLNYKEFNSLISQARFVITDSGGIQEETSYLGIPCFTLRPNTERPETIFLGTNTLICKDDIPKLLDFPVKNTPIDIHGWDGNAGIRIAEELGSILYQIM